MKKLLILVGMLLMLGGCAGNGFVIFYKGQTLEQVQASGYATTCQVPEVRALPPGDPDVVGNMMYAEGFAPIGTSAWEGPVDEGNAEALIQGKNVGACLVLWKADYAHTRQGNMPMSVYTPGGTSTTTHSGTVYSGGSTGTYSGTSTTYNPGTMRTQYIPYSVRRYDYFAVYFARLINDPQALMVRVDTPPDSYMRATDSRSGVLVKAVMKDGSAYNANIFPGDIIMSINGQPASKDISPRSQLKLGDNELTVWRDGKIITKTVIIPTI